VSQRAPSTVVGAALFVAVCIAVGQAATYALNLVAARRLGPASFGELASLLGILAIGNVVALGVQAVAARRIVVADLEVRDGVSAAVLRAALPAGLGVAAGVVVTLPVTVALLHLSGPIDVLLVAIALVPLTVVGGQLGVAQGNESSRVLGLSYLTGGVAKSAGGIAGAVLTTSVTGTLLGLAVGSVAGATVIQLLVRHLVGGRPEPLPGLRSEVLHASHALAALFVLTNVDLLLARHFLTPVYAGIYAAGSIVVKVAFWLPQAIIVLAFPGMADHRRRRALVLGGTAVALLASVIVLGAWLFPQFVVAVVGGAAYAALAPIVWMFALLGGAQSLAQFLLYSRLAVEDRRAVLALWTGVAALVTVVWVGPHSTPRDIVLDATAVILALCIAGALLARAELSHEDAPDLSGATPVQDPST